MRGAQGNEPSLCPRAVEIEDTRDTDQERTPLESAWIVRQTTTVLSRSEPRRRTCTDQVHGITATSVCLMKDSNSAVDAAGVFQIVTNTAIRSRPFSLSAKWESP